jgi:hypothetical protein
MMNSWLKLRIIVLMVITLIIGLLAMAGVGRTQGDPRPNPPGSNPDMGAYESPLSVPNDDEAQGKLYILESEGLLHRMNLDGSGEEVVRSDLSGDNSYITLDLTAGVAYVTRWSGTNQIGRANLDGTGSVAYLYDGESDGGQGIALDITAGKVYWGLYYHGVYTANMDGSGSWTKLVDASALWPGHGQRGQLQVDGANQHVYFRTAQNGPCGDCPGRKIWRVNFDGSDLTPVYQVGNGDALALDLAGNKMYFSDGPPVNAQPNTVVRTNLDGSNVEELLTLPNPYRYLRTIALDVAGGKMYMSVVDPDSGWRDWAIMRANLDGSGLETLYTWTGSGQAAITLDLPDSPKKTIFLPIIIK